MQEGDPESLLTLYRNLIRLRRSSDALQRGSWLPMNNGKDGVLAYFRNTEKERILVILNFTGRQKAITLPEHLYGSVLMSTHRSPGEYSYFQKMQISPYEATICMAIE
jgi:glycosidase